MTTFGIDAPALTCGDELADAFECLELFIFGAGGRPGLTGVGKR